MKACLLFVYCAIVGSQGQWAGYRGMSLTVQDDDGKTLTFKTSSSSSSEETQRIRRSSEENVIPGNSSFRQLDPYGGGGVAPVPYGGGGIAPVPYGGGGITPGTGPEYGIPIVKPSQESAERGYHECPKHSEWNGHKCVRHRSIKCYPPHCSVKPSKESGEGHWCRPGCHWIHHHCVCHHDSGEPSVKKLVYAGLDLLKAGKTLKFNVDVKNPEALLGANELKKCRYPPCSTEVTGEQTEPSKESGEGHYCRPGCHWIHHHCVCHHASGEPSVQKLVSAGLNLLKAGKTLKFNTNLKNPEALLGANQA